MAHNDFEIALFHLHRFVSRAGLDKQVVITFDFHDRMNLGHFESQFKMETKDLGLINQFINNRNNFQMFGFKVILKDCSS